MEKTSYAPGTPCWVDLGSPDPEAAAAFYSGVFGWDVVELGPEAGGYVMFRLRGKSVAAVGPQLPEQPPGVPPMWTTYIAVADADVTADSVKANGGEVLAPPFDVMDSGRMAVALDTVGAPFSLWQPGRHIGAEIVDEPGALCGNELAVRDPQTAKLFYESVFGWETRANQSGGTTYFEFHHGGVPVAGMMTMNEMWPPDVPSHWMVYFAVDDTDATADRANALGGSVMVPPNDIEPGRFAVLNDPHGAVFSIVKAKPGLFGG